MFLELTKYKTGFKKIMTPEEDCTVVKAMSHKFCVSSDRCSDGQEEHIEEKLDPSLLDLQGTDLVASSPILVEGKAYQVSGRMIIDAHVSTTLTTACAMCNEPTSIDIDIPQWLYEQECDSIHGSEWDLTEALREEILLAVPFFTQCGGDVCRNMAEIRTFVRPEEENESEGKGYQPFLELL